MVDLFLQSYLGDSDLNLNAQNYHYAWMQATSFGAQSAHCAEEDQFLERLSAKHGYT